jgi:hypothetical protein
LTLRGLRHRIFQESSNQTNLEKEFMMSCKGLLAIAIIIGLTLSAAVGFGTQDDAGPKAFFPQTRYEFPPVLDGEKVMHEFVVQNKGKATLNIERVKTG